MWFGIFTLGTLGYYPNLGISDFKLILCGIYLWKTLKTLSWTGLGCGKTCWWWLGNWDGGDWEGDWEGQPRSPFVKFDTGVVEVV